MSRTRNGRARAWLDNHVDFTGADCLIWPFNCDAHGYGLIQDNGKLARTSRIMCKLRHGEPPTPKHEAAHNCGKGHLGCVNPQHLQWKTAKENSADKLIHGTSQRGEKHGGAKLTEADVIAIRAISGISQRMIAKRYGVNQAQISLIIQHKRWAWL